MEGRGDVANDKSEVVIEIEPYVPVKAEPDEGEIGEEDDFNSEYEDTYPIRNEVESENSNDEVEENYDDDEEEDPDESLDDGETLANVKRELEDAESGEEYDEEGQVYHNTEDAAEYQEESDRESELSLETTPSTSSQGNSMIYIEVPAIDSQACEICGAPGIKRNRGRRKRFRCAKCFKKRIFRGRRKKPEEKEKPLLLRQFECSICLKRFKRNAQRNKHMKLHLEPLKFQCDVCFKRFNQIGNLLRHKITHSDEKHFQCSTCLKTFSQQAYLKKHEQIHTGIKPHACAVCDKRFSDYSTLSKHRLIHTGLKPYVCNICFKSFNQCSSLKRHSLVHTKEKRFECDVCYKKFSRADRLKRHQSVHIPKVHNYSEVAIEQCINAVIEKYLTDNNCVQEDDNNSVKVES